MLMSTILNTVAKDAIKPTDVMTLNFVDKNHESVVIPIKNTAEAVIILKEIRGY